MPSSLIFTLLIFTCLFIWFEARFLFKRRAFKELIVTCLLLLLALSYGMDYAMEWQLLPNPNLSLTILKPVSESMEKFFQVKS